MPFRRRDNYSALDEDSTPLGLGCMLEDLDTSPAVINVEQQHDDTTVVNPNIIHKVPKNKEGWTHIKDLDSFFARMYRYYIRGGFYPMFMSDLFYLIQFIFIIWFSTFLVYCVKYPTLFRNEPNSTRIEKLTLNDVIYPSSQCIERITWKWWSLIVLAAIIWVMRLILSVYHLYYAFDTKLFYNNALKINDSDLVWISWATIQERVREAQSEHNMCVQKLEVTDLDIYHRILRFDNYLVAMVNKNLLPLQIHVPLLGDFHYLSRGLKWNLEFLLFSSPWSPWENFWQLRRSYKDSMKRMVLAKHIERQLLMMAIVNILMAPIILAWQILYFFFQYAELVRRSPASLGLRTWSVYARVTLRHFNELEHELWDRLNRAYKPATKYLNSFSSPVTTVIAKNVVFLSASVLGVLVVLTVYDEDVITVEHVLTIITFLGCVLAAARGLIAEEERLGGGCAGPARGEELFVRVLGHVHYLPAEWRPHAHTRDVAAHFQQLFQFRAVYILFELLSPVLCPLMLLRLRARSVDIVDFYRNFTVNVTGIGDVCSFAKLDIRRHGHPEWRTPGRGGQKYKVDGAQCEQGEGGKTELSLVAFSCRHPGWQPADPAQRLFLRSLRQSIEHALPVSSGLMNKTMMGSYIQQSVYSANTPLPAVFSYYQHARPTHRLPDMDETSEEEDDEPVAGPANVRSSHSGQSGHVLDQSDHMLGRSDHMLGRSDSMLGRSDSMLGRSGGALRHGSPSREQSALRSELAGVSSSLCSSALGLEPAVAPPANDTLDMTVSALHLYDLHVSQKESRLPSCCANNCTERDERSRGATSEHTPLLPRP